MKDKDDKKLKDLLTSYGMEEPSAHFSEALVEAVLQTRPLKVAAPVRENTWLGSLIIGFMLCAVLVVLFILNPFAIDPVATSSVLAFVMGLWVIILFHKVINNRITPG